jgi:hypothetical protein
VKQAAAFNKSKPKRMPASFTILGALRRAEMQLERVARRRWLACLIVVLVALGMRAALLPVLPAPTTAYMQDEFSYLLGGETFAMGRLANPPHPMWRFFEMPMENMHPTYISKYPPAQAAFLALGIRLFGQPWYGVWLSMGLLCGALCWMLQGWLPPKYAITGGVLAAMQLGVAGYWVNSYWGGAVAALGGALVIGALPRLVRKPFFGSASAAAAGVFLLANSRPFEGLVLVALLGAGLLWWSWHCRNLRNLFRAGVIVPLAVGILGTAGFTAFYNYKTTGNPLLMPYVVNSREYHTSPPLWILPASSRPAVFRDSAMEEQWNWDHDLHTKARHNPLHVVGSMGHAFFSTFVDGAGLALIPFFVAGFLLISSFRARIAVCLLITFTCLLMLEQYIQAHYTAPGFGLIIVVLMFGLQLFRTMKVRGKAVGLPLVAGMLLLSVLFFLDDTARYIVNIRDAPLTPLRYRAQVLKELETKPGRHLVMVRYGRDHNFLIEHVINGPDIDAQKIVWALDRGAEDQALFAYYPDRTVWLYQPDGPAPSITPWQ